jgi:hypothetical protein
MEYDDAHGRDILVKSFLKRAARGLPPAGLRAVCGLALVVLASPMAFATSAPTGTAASGTEAAEPCLPDVAFGALLDALTVRAIDVDHDRDMDLVVVTVIPAGEVVAVWLNDGLGRFMEGSLPPAPPVASRIGRTLDTGAGDDAVPAFTGPPRRAGDAVGVARARAPSTVSRPLPAASACPRRTLDASPSTGPRAPPSLTLRLFA